MQDLKFSIVIPTRERAETLKYCLKTCIEQEQFENYEIIVSDNNSSAATKQVIDELKSEKIKYFFSNKTLAMHENFEFAVSQAKGEYIIVLGDDDGLLLRGLYNLNQLIDQTKSKAIAWRWILYYWPEGVPLGCENSIHIPVSRNVEWVNGRQRIKEVVEFKKTYNYLPMLYLNGAIHRDLIIELRRKTGRIFGSVTPDCYSAFSLGYLSNTFLFLDQPFSVAGMSKHGNGNNQFNKKSNNNITREFNSLNNASSIQFHKQVPNIRSMNAIVSEVFLQAKEKIFNEDEELVLDRKEMILKCLEDIIVYDDNEWEESMKLIESSLQDDEDLVLWFKELLSDMKPKISDMNARQNVRKGLNQNTLVIDGFSFGCKNVYDVAKFYNMNFQNDIELPVKLFSYNGKINSNSIPYKIFNRFKRAARIVIKGY